MIKSILYIHGMGGGADSRIPAFLNECFRTQGQDIQVVVRTYDFRPDRAAEQIDAWFEELRPSLVIGESLGANHALALFQRLPGNALPPLLLVSPALHAPAFLHAMRGAAHIPLIHNLLNRSFRPKEGDRQSLDFSPENLKAWGDFRFKGYRQEGFPVHAFFGCHDHYRRWGVVSLRQWDSHFGPDTRTLYDGTHYMEEEHLKALLIPAILERI